MTEQEEKALDLIAKGYGYEQNATALDIVKTPAETNRRQEKIITEIRKDRVPEWLQAVGQQTRTNYKCECWTCRCASSARIVDLV